MVLWLARILIRPRPKLFRSPVDYLLLGFFILTGVSAFLSYEPMTSIGKLRAASLFTIVYLVAQNVPSHRAIRALAVVLIGSCMFNAIYTLGERVRGRGVKVGDVSADSPLSAGTTMINRRLSTFAIRKGDTLLEVDGRPISNLSELVAALDGSQTAGPAEVRVYRVEWIPVVKVPRGRLLTGSTGEEKLGITNWTRGRDWRAAGFYGHYVTYAEVLQLVIALAVGLLIALKERRSTIGLILSLSILTFLIALLLTVTRASWLGCLTSTATILLLGLPRRTAVLLILLTIPLVFAALLLLHQKRQVGFLDSRDDSIGWRQTVWREGYELLTSKPRHLLVGVGMDSIKAHWREWNLFEQGRRPIGHMHSNLLQLGLERGIPTLILWLLMLVTYASMLWRLIRRNLIDDWVEHGVVLGALGGLVGFFVSGLVHYNWGDSEVVTIFYLIMGMTLALNHRYTVQE